MTEPVDAGVAGLPFWLPRISLAEEISPEAMSLAAMTVGENPPHDGWRDLFDRLIASGHLVRPDAGDSLQLDPEARKAFLARLRDDPGLDQARAEAVAAGLANETVAMAGQLAVWARHGGDWASLQALWFRFPSREFVKTPQSRQAFLGVPSEKRRSFPALSYAAAFVGAWDDASSPFDLDHFLTALISDGRTLHASWARHTDVDAAVMAGTMRLLAQSSMMDPAEDPQHEQPFATYRGIKAFIAEQNDNGGAPSPLPLAFFHTAASLVMILRADWMNAKYHAELAIAVGQPFILIGLLASSALALTMTMMGSQSGYEKAEQIWRRFAEAWPELGAAVEGPMLLPRMAVAVRKLDADATHGLIERLASGTAISRWFNFWPIQVWIQTNAAMLWSSPEQALSEFDSKTSGMVVSGGDRFGVWHPLLVRARAELLINIGALNEAKRIVEELGNSRRGFSLATAARVQLAAGDYKAAINLADEGMHSSQVAVYERAHLQTIKAAAMELSGYEAEAVDRQVVAACLVSRESGTLVPFAMIPSDVRTALLARHHEHPDGSPCVLAEPIAAGSFDRFTRNYGRSQALVTLSRREQVLLPLLVSSLTLKEIADQLYVSTNTVRNQAVTLRKKLGASNRAELSERARELGLLQRSGQGAKPSR